MENQMESNILLVDDVQLFLEIQKDFLKHSPINVTTARSSVAALQLIKTERPDLIFMDYEMPEMNGADCCRAIKSDPASAAIPVVMITARGDQESEAICRHAGCNEFLTKPLDRKIFLETAARFVGNVERRETRKTVKLPGAIHSRGTTLPCLVESLSSNGAFIVSDFPAEVGRVIQTSIDLPDGSTIECKGSIVWTKGAGLAKNGFGVSFVLPSASTKSALIDFLKKQ
jgi:CheY-like chemotaxis protein